MLSSMDFNSINYTPPILRPEIPDMSKHVDEMAKAVQAGREEFIQNIAEATGRELARAIRTSPDLFDEIIGALSSLCGNPTYNSTTLEDPMNDYVRDILGHGLQVRDQTRQGISGNSRSAVKGQTGEVDIQIRNNGKPIGIYEGLRLEAVDSAEIYKHIEKVTVNYNPQGVKEVFVAAYVRGHKTGFGDFWKRMMGCVKGYEASDAEYQIVWDEEEEDTGLSAVRAIHGIYNMDDAEHNVHVIAVKLME